MSLRSSLLAAATLFSSINAHIIMVSPVPYSVDKIDSSPITASQYPCKSQNGFTVSTMNNMAVGQQQSISFKGSAVHGGGSCQLSVTLDTNPTPKSVFKVIKSIEGGCPGVNSATNVYNFSLPDSIPNGKATFAWTWFSKESGAPELYMNCAPIDVTGGASDQTAFSKLPDILVANIGEGCTSPQNYATLYPDPGSVVQNGGTNDLKPPTGNCGPSGGNSTTPAQPSSPANGQPSSPANGQSSAPASTPASKASATGGVFAPGASSAVAGTSTTLVTVTAPAQAQPTEPSSPSVPAAAPMPSGTGTSSPSSPSSGEAGGTCTTNGAVVCNGEKQFGLCNNGKVVWQDVAAGTACVNGVISKRSFNGRVARPRV